MPVYHLLVRLRMPLCATLNRSRSFYNNPKNPFGYGVFTGEEGSLYFLERACIDIQNGDVVMLTTDGMDLIFHSDNLIGLRDKNPTTLIDYAEKLEMDRRLTSDDKSIITLSITDQV